MVKPTNNNEIKNRISKKFKKRTHKEIFKDNEEDVNNSHLTKKKNIKKNPNDIMVKYDIEAIYQLINLKEKDKLELEIGVMDNQIYEEQFFDFIDNAGDGKLFY